MLTVSEPPNVPSARHERLRGRRVLLVTHRLDLTGAPRSLLMIASALREAGAVVGILAGRDGPLGAEAEALGVEVEVADPGLAPVWGVASSLRPLVGSWRMRRRIRRWRADLVVANTMETFPAVRAARALGLPVAWILRESLDPSATTTSHRRWLRRALGPGVECIFVAEATRQLWAPHLRGAGAHVVPNGVDLARVDAYCAATSSEEARQALGVGVRRVVLLVGTICHRKGQHVFLDAALLARRRHPEALFVMVGARQGAFEGRLRAEVARARAEDSVRLVAETTHVDRWYRAADVCVLASFVESHPRVVLEAMAFGRPLVASDVYGVPEQVRHEQEALLVRPGQPVALAQAIERLLDQPHLAAQLGAAARRRCEQRFTRAHNQRAMVELLGGLV